MQVDRRALTLSAARLMRGCARSLTPLRVSRLRCTGAAGFAPTLLHERWGRAD